MYCPVCHTLIDDGNLFCPRCGAKITVTSSTQNQHQNHSPEWNSTFHQTSQEHNHSNWSYASSPSSVSNRKLIFALTYIPILFWLPLVLLKQDPESKKYANQGFVLLLANIVLGLLQKAANVLLSWLFFPIPLLCSLIFSLLGLVLFVLCIIGIVKALKGEYFEIPLLGILKILD